MLTLSRAIKAGQGEYYLSLATADDYYLSGEEPSGYWLGSGAVALGLGGDVEPAAFRHLLRGLSPEGTRKLVRNVDAERRAGWDLTWSVPKSVSVAWSQANSETRGQIEACVRKAVAAGVRYLEAVAGLTRRGADGHIREPAKLILAAFLHSTSRAQDPQLHIHTVLLNVGVRLDGTTGTIEPRELYRHQMAAGALFRAELAAVLEAELGLRSRREGRAFEVLGVDPDLIAFFSKRRQEIEAELARFGQSGAKAAEAANFATRRAKEARPREALFREWQRIGREHHWSEKQLSWLLHAPFPPRLPAWEQSAAQTEALIAITTTQSHFSARQLLQVVAECCQGRALGAVTALALRNEMLRFSEVVPLVELKGEFQFTTREILALEGAARGRAEGMNARRELFPDRPVQEALSRHPGLTTEQQEALRHVCAGRGGVSLVQGLAGTGKSTLFAVAREVWEAQGFSVLGAALAGKAALGLQQSTGIECTTVHRLLEDLRSRYLPLDCQSVILLDEASMIGTRQLAEVIDRCAAAGASLVLCGDVRQLQAVELGGLFAALAERLPSARLTEIRRQREDWTKQAVKDLAYGRADDALLAYEARGLLTEKKHVVTATDRLMEDWKREALPELASSVILASTRQDVMELNRRAQAERQRLGQLGTLGVKAGPNTLFPEDRVLFTRNSSLLGVCNGDLGSVQKCFGSSIHVRLDDGRLVTADLEQYPCLQLGYALTTHKAQGMTVERSFILTGAALTHREMAYVQASRARGTTRWYVSDDREDVTRRMAQSHEKLAAITLAEGLELSLVR